MLPSSFYFIYVLIIAANNNNNNNKGGPCVLPTTAPLSYLDLQDLAALLETSGHSDLVSLETWSRDAGTYYCNDQFYSTLNAVRAGSDAGSSLIPVGGSSDRAADWPTKTSALFS